jgi:hypothetical protein
VAFVFFQQAEQEDFKVDVSIIYVYIWNEKSSLCILYF